MVIYHIALIFLGIFLTQFLRNRRMDSVRASSLATILLCCLLVLLKLGSPAGYALVFGGSFIGMSSIRAFSKFMILFASITFYLLYLFFQLYLPGIGGTLGFCALCSAFATIKLVPACPEYKS